MRTRHHGQAQTNLISRNVLLGCILFTLLTAIYPFARSAFRIQVGYNEGWNIFSAERVVNHLPLYPEAYGWTMVNYPMLSFELMAWLHRFTHDYLYTARVISLISLIGCCLLVAAIVRHLSHSMRAALLSGLLCLAIFCTNADGYVGMDDPQLLAHFVSLLAFFVFVRRPESNLAVALAATLFVVAGSIKHNALDIPLAVLIELTLLSWRRALWFAAWGLGLAACSVALNIRIGGPAFLPELLAPRVYSYSEIWDAAVNGLGPLLIPVLVSLAAGAVFLREPRRRVAAVLLFSSLLVGLAFGGGIGVAINTFFSFFFAISIVFGLVFAEIEHGRWKARRLFGLPLAGYAAPALFAWLMIPALVHHIANPVAMLCETAREQARFDNEVAFLRSNPGPALCESLLLCYVAGKPYIYDPFNATRLILLHKLDPKPVVEGLRNGKYSTVEWEQPAESVVKLERFPPALREAILENYQPAMQDREVVIFVPKRIAATRPAP